MDLLEIAGFNVLYLLFGMLKYHCGFALMEDWDCEKCSGTQYEMRTTMQNRRQCQGNSLILFNSLAF